MKRLFHIKSSTQNNNFYFKNTTDNHYCFLTGLNRFKNRKINKNKFSKIMKTFELFHRLGFLYYRENLEFNTSNFGKFKKFLVDKKTIVELKYKEIKEIDICLYLNSEEYSSFNLAEDSYIKRSFQNKGEFLIEKNILISREMKDLSKDIEEIFKDNHSEENNLKNIISVLGPIGSGKSLLMKIYRLFQINNGSFVLFFDNYILNKSLEDIVISIIEEIMFAFNRVISSDVVSNLEFNTLRDLYKIYSLTFEENSTSIDIDKRNVIIYQEISRVLLNMTKFAEENKTDFTIYFDNIHNLDKNIFENNSIIDLIIKEKIGKNIIVSFSDNFSKRYFNNRFDNLAHHYKLYKKYDLDLIKHMILNNTIYKNYDAKYSCENWRIIIEQSLDKRNYILPRKEIFKDFSLFSLFEHYTKLNPIFVNLFIKAMIEEYEDLENDYLIVDSLIDNYEYKSKSEVSNLIRDYLNYQISTGKMFNNLLLEFQQIMKQIINPEKSKEISSEIICDNFIFYSEGNKVKCNLPFLLETLIEIMKN